MTLREKDKALICNEKHGNGRCRKLLVTGDGNLLCKNGHTVTIGEAWNAYLSRPDWDSDAIGHLWPVERTMAEIIKRIASPEFLQAEFPEWQVGMVDYLPFLSWLIHNAGHIDRKAMLALKEFWEKEIRRKFPLLGRYLDALKEKEGANSATYIRAREQLFRSLWMWSGYGSGPEDFLALWEVLAEAAEYLGDQNVVLYQHNVMEAVKCIKSGGKDAPLYFERVLNDGDVDFFILADPLKKRGVLQGHQLAFTYRHDIGDIKWHAECTLRKNNVTCRIRNRLNERRERIKASAVEGASWSFHTDDGDHCYIEFFHPKDGWGGYKPGRNPTEALEVMKELHHQLGRNLSYLFEPEAL